MKPPQPCSSGNTCKASHHGERHTRRTGQTEQARRSPGLPVTGCGMSLELDLKFDVLLTADIQNSNLAVLLEALRAFSSGSGLTTPTPLMRATVSPTVRLPLGANLS